MREGAEMVNDNMLRIHVRIDLTVGENPVAVADLALPAGSSLAEILDEVLELTGAPVISRPWIARTAAGGRIDAGIPLARTQLEQGGVLVLSPQRELPAPVVRDAAEALVELSTRASPHGLPDAVILSGLCGVALLLGLGASLGASISMAVTAAICLLVLAWLPRVQAPVSTAALPVAASLLCAVATGLRVDASPGPWPLLAACAAGLLVTLLLHLFFAPRLLISMTMATIYALLLVTASALAIRTEGAAALTVAVALILISLAPGVSAQLAGLRVPTLPTAGQDLSVSDAELPDPERRARAAQTLHDVQLLATALVGGPMVILTALTGTWASTAFCLCIAVACLLHGLRHNRTIPLWSLVLLGCASLIATVVSSCLQDQGWPPLALAVVLTGFCVGVPAWMPLMPTLQPTTLVWLERLESLCMAAALPLALHLLNIFGLLRGLNIALGE
ncbi:type VII secretion integral membrane protein EccD [Corynebacterium pacaense]|uniref:type VII secretion integral membrane protein EccD n=1 Tax=Corynebacterium pacaense TaxID=1816684 RepID=UPI001FE979FD|nr:type VII secretion integral membrane protein EccD [Corynebacterium pacaense]